MTATSPNRNDPCFAMSPNAPDVSFLGQCGVAALHKLNQNDADGVFRDIAMTYLLDASGVLYNDGVPFPGVVDAVHALQSQGPVYIATNNTSASPEEISQSLSQMGIHVPVSHILSSGLTLAADPALQQSVAGKAVFLYGIPSAGVYVSMAGGHVVAAPEDAEVFVLTHATPAATTDPLFCRMVDHQQRHPDLPMICLNPDRYVVSGASLYPVVGDVAAQFPQMQWAGKPHDNYAVHVVAATLAKAGIVLDRHVTFVDDNPENVQAMCRCLGISGIVVTETGLAGHAPWRSQLENLGHGIRCVPGLWDLYPSQTAV